MAMGRPDRVVFLAFAGVVGLYVAMRAALVPMVHDECATVAWYIRSGVWRPYQAHWDAGNHYLATGIGLLSARLFGGSPFALRAGDLLAYVLYAYATWRLGARFRSRTPRLCLQAALLLCPYLLDFFSLFRGYGIEMAGWLFALDGLLRYARSKASRHLFQTLVGLLVAGASIVALVPVWALVLVLLVAVGWGARDTRWTQLTLWTLFGVVPLILASAIAFQLKARGLLYHGSTDGFFAVSVTSLCRYVLGSTAVLTASIVCLVLLALGMVAVQHAWRASTWRDPMVLIYLLLGCDVLARVMLAQVFGVNYPEDRAALHLVPLAVLAIALTADRLSMQHARWTWAATLLLILPARTLWTANLDHTLAWPEQAVPERFMRQTLGSGDAPGHARLVGGQHQLALVWPMNAYWQGLPVPPMQVVGFPKGPHDLRIVDERYLREALPGYHAIDSAKGPGLWLLERDTPLSMTLAITLVSPARSTRDEFDELAHIPDTLLHAHAVQLVVDVPLSLIPSAPDLRLVLEVNDREGNKLFYDAMGPLALRPNWRGEPLHWTWRLPALPGASRAVLYFHNPGKVMLARGIAKVAVSTIRE